MLKCEQCGKSLDQDLLALFTQRQVCKECVKKNHEKAMGKRKNKKERRF